MTIRELTLQQVGTIYKTRLVHDFPPDERKPLDMIRRAYAKHEYVSYGLWAGETLLAYAFFVRLDRLYLLDYFAVEAQSRGRGIGSVFLSRLAQILAQAEMVLIEVEDTAYARTEAQRQIRQRREQFYQRCGCVRTAVCAELFSVVYRLYELPVQQPHDSGRIRRAYSSVYRHILPWYFLHKMNFLS